MAPVRTTVARLASPAFLVGAGVFLAVSVFLLWKTAATPGYARDETSISLNAFSIARNGRNQSGHLLPLFFKEYADYLSPIYTYLLAVVFKVTGPSKGVAREVGAACVLAALFALGFLARRRTGSAAVGLAAIVLGALTPWLYELSRTTFEMTLEPLMIVLVLLAVDWAYRSQASALIRGIVVALPLGGLTYVYAAGRGLAPLYAGALILFAGRGRWRWLLTTWVAYLVLLVPLVLHLKEAASRYHGTTFIQPGMSVFAIAKQLLSNYATDVNLVYWIHSGDPKPYIHTWGAGQLLAGVVALSVAGVVIVFMRLRSDLWWRWLLAVLVLSPVPAALTVDRHHAQRMLPLPVLLLVVAIPALDRLSRWGQRRLAAGLVLALGVVLLVQFVHFEQIYHQRGAASRAYFFEAGVPSLLSRAFAGGRTVYIDHDDLYAQTDALWYAVTHGMPESRVSILADGGIPPNGSSVFGRLQSCDYVCIQLAAADSYWIAKAAGPKPKPFAVGYAGGFNGVEQFQGSPHRWMIQNGTLVLDNQGGPINAEITGLAFSNQQPRTLALESKSGRVLARATVEVDQAALTLGPFHLPAGPTRLTLVATPGPVRLGAADPRDASVYLSPLTVTETS